MDTRTVEECLYDILVKKGHATKDFLWNYGRSIKTKNCPNGCTYDTISRKIRKLCQYNRITPMDKKGRPTNRRTEFAFKYAVNQ